jgi:hypothetical protein
VGDRVSDPVGRPKGRSFMQPKHEYRCRLPHIQKDNRPIFITFTTDRRRRLPAEARDIVLECCLKENGNKVRPAYCGGHARSCPSLVEPVKRCGWMELQFAPDHAGHQRCICQKNQRSCSAGLVQSGRKNSSIMSCDRMTALRKKLITFVRIPCERGWSKLRVSIVGCGGVLFRFSSGERHTDSGNHAVSTFRYVRLPPLPR